MDWAKTTARRDEKHLSLGIRCTYIRDFTVCIVGSVTRQPNHSTMESRRCVCSSFPMSSRNLGLMALALLAFFIPRSCQGTPTFNIFKWKYLRDGKIFHFVSYNNRYKVTIPWSTLVETTFWYWFHWTPFYIINQSIPIDLLSINTDDTTLPLSHCDTTDQPRFIASCAAVSVIRIKQVYTGTGRICPPSPNNRVICVALTEFLRLRCNRHRQCDSPADILQRCAGDTIYVEYECIPSK